MHTATQSPPIGDETRYMNSVVLLTIQDGICDAPDHTIYVRGEIVTSLTAQSTPTFETTEPLLLGINKDEATQIVTALAIATSCELIQGYISTQDVQSYVQAGWDNLDFLEIWEWVHRHMNDADFADPWDDLPIPTPVAIEQADTPSIHEVRERLEVAWDCSSAPPTNNPQSSNKIPSIHQHNLEPVKTIQQGAPEEQTPLTLLELLFLLFSAIYPW